MDLEESEGHNWFVTHMIDIIQRIRDLYVVCQGNDMVGQNPDLDDNWIRIHDLLIQLHEHVNADAGREILSPLVMRLGAELSVIEGLVGALSSSQRCQPLH